MKKKTDHIAELLINEMFKIAGHDVTYQDVVDRKDNWFQQWSMTEDQRDEWVAWGVDLLRKEARLSKYLAEREMKMFDFQYGLTINWTKTKMD